MAETADVIPHRKVTGSEIEGDLSIQYEKRGRMKTVLHTVMVVMLLVAILSPGLASETGTMRCNGGIVSIGDTAGEVMNKCGQPAFASQREQKKIEEESKGSRKRKVTVVTIDDWTFNFGPDHFQYQVILENGRVTRIESLGYGY